MREAQQPVTPPPPPDHRRLEVIIENESPSGSTQTATQFWWHTMISMLPIAEADLAAADGYIDLLREYGASGGVVAFNDLNVRLAHETLALIREGGAGVKLTRGRVGEIVAAVRQEAGLSG